MVIHSSHEGAVDAEHALDLGGMGELEFPVEITTMLHRPPFSDTFVDGRTIGPKLRPWLHLPKEKMCRVMALDRGSRNDLPRELPRPFLFRHHERHVFEVCLVKLHNAFQDMVFFGQMGAESPVPAPHRVLRQAGPGRRLEDGFLNRPTPQEHPEFLIGEFHVRKPRVREK